MVKKVLLIFFAVLMLIFLFFFAIKTILGERDEGDVNNITELPYGGEHLKDFKVSGNIHYAYSVNHRGQGSVFFSGETSLDNFNSFFSEEHGGQITEEYAPQWRSWLEKRNLDLKKFPIDDSKENVRGVRRFDGAFVEVHYIKRNDKFTGVFRKN